MLGLSFEVFWVLAVVVLGVALFFFGTRIRPLSRAQRERSEQAAREKWGKEKVK